MRIGVIGGGVVGHATARCYLEHVDEIRVYDILKERRTHHLDYVLACDLIFVCLPTPQKKNSLECDTSSVEGFFREYAVGNPAANYVLRSTVPIGTTRRLSERYNLPNLVHSPEFLTARCAVVDAQIPARNIIGIPGFDVLARHPYPGETLCSLYERRFPGVPTYFLSSDESEAVKLFQNSFFAVKVAYWNEVRCLADKLGLDWERIMGAILADGRIAPSHTNVPGPDGKRGFSGSCLPKDLANLIECMWQSEVEPYVTHAAHYRNRHIDRVEDQS